MPTRDAPRGPVPARWAVRSDHRERAGTSAREGVHVAVPSAQSTRQRGRRTYVLDTSVLLADPRALLRFAEHEVVLPLVVITELEGKRAPPRARLLRPPGAAAARRPAGPARPARRSRCPIGDGGTLRVELNHTDPSVAARPASGSATTTPASSPSPRNLAAEGCDVTLVSKDLPMRVKASSVGLHAEEYRAELAVDSGWTGMAELERRAPSRCRRAVRRRPCSSCAEARDLPCHTGLVLLSDARQRRSAG